MKFSKEARIGLLVALALLIFFAGFYFLKGSSLFSRENTYYAYFDDVQGLQSSSPVLIKGLGIGRVAKIEFSNEKVKVTLSISKKVKLMEGTTVKLIATDLLNTKALRLDLGSGSNELPNKAELQGSMEGGLLDNLSSEISPLITDIRKVVGTLDTVMLGVNNMLNTETREHLKNSVAALEVTMKNFSNLSAKLNNESNQLASVIRNANSITSNLAANNQQITNIMHNAEGISNQLANAPLEQTIKDLQATVSQLQGVISKVNNNEGSLGMMVNDKQLYNNLSETLKTLNLLIADLNAHPSRYINVTIFGKKNKDTH